MCLVQLLCARPNVNKYFLSQKMEFLTSTVSQTYVVAQALIFAYIALLYTAINLDINTAILMMRQAKYQSVSDM